MESLAAMLRTLRPRLADDVYAFCRLEDGRSIPQGTLGWFREAEGVTIILPINDAIAANLDVEFEAAWIALGLDSALDAVGLTAAVSGSLAAAGIPCNVVAACRHDHLFVPYSQAAAAMQVLAQMGAATPDRIVS